MNRAHTMELIENTGVIAIIRGEEDWPMDRIAGALYDGGIRAIEITLNTPNALHLITRIKKLGLKDLKVGAGTVLDPQMAGLAVSAGASFILSPTLSPEMIALCNRYDVLGIPGVLTSTEVLYAWELGAQAVKIFPAGVFGPEYIRSLRGPLPQIPMIPVGGVSLANTFEFIRAGACGVGVGGELVDRAAISSGKYDGLTKNASQFIREVKRGRE